MEGAAAALGNSLNLGERKRRVVFREFSDRGLRGMASETSEAPRTALLGDLPASRDRPGVAAAKLDRLAELGKIPQYPNEVHPRGLLARPCKLVVRP